MDETLNNKVRVKKPFQAEEYNGTSLFKRNRYSWLSLDLAEPNLGVPKPATEDADFDLIFPTTFTNSYGISTIIFNEGEYLADPESGASYNDLKIDIWFDATSTSQAFGGDVTTANTRSLFQQFSAPTTTTGMYHVSGLLRDKLLPFYNNDPGLLNQNVQIRYVNPFRTAGIERTLSWAASSLRLTNGAINPGSRKIVLIFADESNNIYHADPLNVSSNTTANYSTDYDELTAAYQERFLANCVTTKVYHVVVGKEPASSPWANNYWDFLNALIIPGAGGNSYGTKNFVNYSIIQHPTFSIDRVYRGALVSYYVNEIMTLLKNTTTQTIPNGYGYPGSFYTDTYYLTSDLLGFRGWTSKPAVLESSFTSLERPDLKTTSLALEDLLYIEPKLTYYTLNNKQVDYLQPGESSNNSLLRWGINKKNHMAMNSYTIDYGNRRVVLYKSDMYKIQNLTVEVPFTLPVGVTPGSLRVRTYTAGISGTIKPALLKPSFDVTNSNIITGFNVESPGIYNTPHIDVKIESITDRWVSQPNLGYLLLLKDNFGLWDTDQTSKNLLFNADLSLWRGNRTISSSIVAPLMNADTGSLGYEKGIQIPTSNIPVGNYTVEQKDSTSQDFSIINTPYYQRITTNISSIGTTPLHLLTSEGYGVLLVNNFNVEYPPKIDTHFGKKVNISFYARASQNAKIFAEHQVHAGFPTPFNFWTPTIHEIFDLTTEWKKYTFSFIAPTESQVRAAAYNNNTIGLPASPTYIARTSLPPVSSWASQLDIKLFWTLSGHNRAGNYAPNRPPYIGQAMTLQELSAVTETFITNGYYDIANVTYLVGGKEFNYFNPLSSKDVSFDIGELTGNTVMQSTTAIRLTGADWKNNTDIGVVSATTTGYVYYGISTNNYLNITEIDILTGVNFPGRGASKILTDRPYRSYRQDCSVDPINAPFGYYYYIAYPAFIPNIQTIINNFNVTNRELTLTLSGDFVNDLPYKVTISNNIQKGVIPIEIK